MKLLLQWVVHGSSLSGCRDAGHAGIEQHCSQWLHFLDENRPWRFITAHFTLWFDIMPVFYKSFAVGM